MLNVPSKFFWGGGEGGGRGIPTVRSIEIRDNEFEGSKPRINALWRVELLHLISTTKQTYIQDFEAFGS